MRDAFGGVFTMNLLLVFIFIYVAVTAVSLNYAKAFKVKNAVIDFVEENAINDLDEYFGFLGTKDIDALDKELGRLSYHKTCEEIGYEDSRLVQNIYNLVRPDEYCYKGVVISIKPDKTNEIEGTNSEIIYYEIKTYANWNLGAFNKLLTLIGQSSENPLTGTWTITGEAKVVKKK